MPHQRRISIWFFIGLILLVYGALIVGASIYDLSNPPEHPTVLANLHPGIWWGALILALGILYTFLFSPRRTQ